MEWPTWVVLLALGAIVWLLIMIYAALEGIRVDVNIMEHRSRALADELSGMCHDVSTI